MIKEVVVKTCKQALAPAAQFNGVLSAMAICRMQLKLVEQRGCCREVATNIA